MFHPHGAPIARVGCNDFSTLSNSATAGYYQPPSELFFSVLVSCTSISRLLCSTQSHWLIQWNILTVKSPGLQTRDSSGLGPVRGLLYVMVVLLLALFAGLIQHVISITTTLGMILGISGKL